MRGGVHFVWVLSAVALAAFLVAAHSFYVRTNRAADRFCTLDKTLVTFIDQSLGEITLSDAATYPAAYLRSYRQQTGLVRQLVAQAPCKFPYRIPRNLLRP